MKIRNWTTHEKGAWFLLLLLPLLCTGLFGFAWKRGALEGPENFFRDTRLRLRHALHLGPAVDERIELVAIDEATLKALGTSEALWFEDHLKVLENLAERRPRAVVLTVPWGPAPPPASRWPDLAWAFGRASNRLAALKKNHPVVVRSSPTTFEPLPSPDGVVRRYAAGQILFEAAGRLGVKAGDEDLWLDFTRGRFRAPSSFLEMRQGALEPPPGKIFLIGRTDRTVQTPLGPMTELELQAQALNTLLQPGTIRTAPFWLEIAVVFLFCLVVCVIGLRTPPPAAPWWTLLANLVWWALAALIFLTGRLWVNITGPALVSLPCLVGTLAIRVRLLERERQRIRQLLSTRVSEDVIESLFEHPEWTDFRGKRRRITMLFSDITGFTAACERLAPEEVLRRLNNYLLEMSQIVFRHGGTIRQFAGDEMVVLFGTPIESENHAVRAVQTALDMLDRLRVLEVEDPEGFHKVKIGIHTGEVVVGDVGSPIRAEFTAVGDAMNVTARIETLNKEMKTQLLISNSTRLEVYGHLQGVRFRSLGFRVFKGKREPVEVFTVEREQDDGGWRPPEK